jgi:hypothetical protein
MAEAPRKVPLPLLVLLAACAVPREPIAAATATAAAPDGSLASSTRDPRDSPPWFQDAAHSVHGTFGERFTAEVFWLPAVWLEVDEKNRLAPNAAADVAIGSGVGMRAAIGNKDQSIGLLYMGTFHDENTTGANVRTDSIYLDFDVAMPAVPDTNAVLVRAGAGVGVAFVEFNQSFDDASTLAFNLRLGLDYQPSPRVSLGVGLGGFIWGNPGDTVAFGSFVLLGGTLSF